MPTPLPRTLRRMIDNDHSEALLKYLSDHPEFHPNQYHLQKEPLVLFCSQYGAPSCALTLLRAFPDFQTTWLMDQNYAHQTALDFLTPQLSLSDNQRLLTESPEAFQDSASNPFLQAVYSARWDLAEFWFQHNPSWLPTDLPRGKNILHALAEPTLSWDQRQKNLPQDSDAVDVDLPDAPTRSSFLPPQWPRPSTSLIQQLIAAGVSPIQSLYPYSPLHRALFRHHRSFVDTVFNALPSSDITLFLTSPCNTSSSHSDSSSYSSCGVHYLAFFRDFNLFKRLTDSIPPASFLPLISDQGYSLLDIAVMTDQPDLAEYLISLGIKDHLLPHQGPAPYAFSTSKPFEWLEFLNDRGIDLNLRNPHMTHWAELFWELHPYQPELLTDPRYASFDFYPPRDILNPLGILERASRSSHDAALKLQHLTAYGLSSSHIASKKSVLTSSSSPMETLDSLFDEYEHSYLYQYRFSRSQPPYHHSLPLTHWTAETDYTSFCYKTFGSSQPPASYSSPSPSYAHTTQHLLPSVLQPLLTESLHLNQSTLKSYQTLLPASSSSGGFRSSLDIDSPSRNPTPCLLVYTAQPAYREAFHFWLEYDQQHSCFSTLDYCAAWVYALQKKSPLSFLQPLYQALSSQGIDPWSPLATKAFLSHSPSLFKLQQLNFPLQPFDRLVDSAFSLTTLEFPPFLSDSSFPEWLFSSSKPDHPFKTQLKRLTRQPTFSSTTWSYLIQPSASSALTCAFFLLAQLSCGHAQACSLFLNQVQDLAAHSPSDSPWGQHPSQALSLWQDQMVWEYRQLHPQADHDPSFYFSFFYSQFMNLLLLHDISLAAQYLEQGFPTPSYALISQHYVRFFQPQSLHNEEDLNALRHFTEILCSRSDLISSIQPCPQLPHIKVLQALELQTTGTSPRSTSEQTLHDAFGLIQQSFSFLPDPFIFDSFLQTKLFEHTQSILNSPSASDDLSDPFLNSLSLESPAPQSFNVFNSLVRQCTSRLSPSFVRRLTQLSLTEHPRDSFELLTSLVKMPFPSHEKYTYFLNSSAVHTQRFHECYQTLTAHQTLPWDSLKPDTCPIHQAFMNERYDLGFFLMEQAPSSYLSLNESTLIQTYLHHRLNMIGRIMGAFYKDRFPDAFRNHRTNHTPEEVEAFPSFIEAEIQRFTTRGLSFQDHLTSSSFFLADFKGRCWYHALAAFLFLLDRQLLNPHSLVSDFPLLSFNFSSLMTQAPSFLSKMKGSYPFVTPFFNEYLFSDQDQYTLYNFWKNSGYPMEGVNESQKRIPLTTFFSPKLLALHEHQLLNEFSTPSSTTPTSRARPRL